MIDSAFERFCLAHPTTVLVPAEMLSADGVHADLADAFIRDGRLNVGQLRTLAEGFARYTRRCRDLFALAPNDWFSPRKVNVVIALEPLSVAPYLDPLKGSSLLLYVSDLDTNPEYVAFLFVHAERLAFVGSVRAATALNLSYWFSRSEDEKRAFVEAAHAATRPDARTYALLADAFAWIPALLHNPLRQPTEAVTEPYAEVQGTSLYVPQRLQAEFITLCEQSEAAVAAALHAAVPTRVKATRTTLDALCDWLQDHRPRLIVASPKGKTLWHPERKDTSSVRDALAAANDSAVASLHEDFLVADARTRQFMSLLREPDMLPRQCGVLETDTSIYVDADRRLIVYRLMQESFDPRVTPAPPLHRFLVGARVMHEWGHLAHTGKYLRVPELRKSEYREARAALGEQFKAVADMAAPHFRQLIDEELNSLQQRFGLDAPAALARKTLARVGDYLANFMSSKLIPAEEMQAYVRLNVRHHVDENLPPISELARYAYEIHYLALAGLDRSYFMETTRFPDLFIAPGIISEDSTYALFDAVGRVLTCYEFDESKLTIPTNLTRQ